LHNFAAIEPYHVERARSQASGCTGSPAIRGSRLSMPARLPGKK
jgi:hypothetical protein